MTGRRKIMSHARTAAAVLGLIVLGGCRSPGDLAAPEGAPGPAGAAADDGKLRIIVFGAHPDDCEIRAGGAGALWAAAGHHVKFVSVSNGDIGHWRMAGGPLASRRRAEALEADRRLGVETEILDIHDGEIEPTLENRRKVVRLIREWKADIVISHRPNDYHPDHRYSAILVQDAGYMVTVPFFCPDVPHLRKNPVFLYSADRFQRPNPFRPDVVVSIDPVLRKKVEALAVMTSQFLEGGANGGEELLPKDDADRERRQDEVKKGFIGRAERIANDYRGKLVDLYGEERGKAVRAAEAFEVCEYGSQPSREELLRLFPFFR